MNNNEISYDSLYNELLQRFSSLSEAKKICMLALLSNNLTVAARETYLAGSEEVENPKQLRIYNEIQHQITNQLVSVLFNKKHRYSDINFVNMFFERSEIFENRNLIIWSLRDAIEKAEK